MVICSIVNVRYGGEEDMSQSDSIETDVVVVGYGAAGATAAITAHDEGASVLILEKMAIGGGNSRVGGANIIIPRDMKFADYLDTITFKTTEREIIDTFVEGVLGIENWIRQMGGELQPFELLKAAYPLRKGSVTFPTVPGAENIFRYKVKGTEGTAAERLWKLLSSNIERRGIRVMLNTPAKELIKNQKGEIVGLIAESAGKAISIKARRGVILTCGGYENDDFLKWDNFPCKPVKFLGNIGNTGDGIRMAQKVGAALWHMGRLSCGIGFQAPEYEAAFGIFFMDSGFIYVDKYGRRFIDETGVDSHEYWKVLSDFDSEKMEYTRIPMYAIFDEDMIRKGPLNPGTSGYNKYKYKWSLDNKAEIKKGWIIKSKTVQELAKRLSMDESTLESTIAKYNESCKLGKDADFGRGVEHMKPIEPSYYAIPLWPALINTQGGPRRDKDARVLDPDGKPIPRLFVAGELGSIWGFLYQTACNIAEGIVFGRIAGRNAATSPQWSENRDSC